MPRRPISRHFAALALCIIAFAVPVAATTLVLDEVVVTATKHAENPQEVPLSIDARWTLADGAARINVSLYRAKYEQLQVALYDPIAAIFIPGNAGAATIQGL